MAAGGTVVDLVSLQGEELRRFRWEKLSLVPQAALNALNPVLTIGSQFATWSWTTVVVAAGKPLLTGEGKSWNLSA